MDLVITQKDEKFVASTYYKNVDHNRFLKFDSGHYSKLNLNVPFVQFTRIRKIVLTMPPLKSKQIYRINLWRKVIPSQSLRMHTVNSR